MKTWWDGWQEVSGKAWRLICQKFPPEQEHREVFQLLAAVYFYHLNGIRKLHELSDERLHQVFAAQRHDKQWDFQDFATLFDFSQSPYFSGMADDKGEMEYFGAMHLSSASFRLSTALTLAAGTDLPRLIPFFNTAGPKRMHLAKYLKEAAELDCSQQFPPELPDELIAPYVTMIVAHRDEFGHGERGERKDVWRDKREEAFCKFKCCRLIEAQLHLLMVGLDVVKKGNP